MVYKKTESDENATVDNSIIIYLLYIMIIQSLESAQSAISEYENVILEELVNSAKNMKDLLPDITRNADSGTNSCLNDDSNGMIRLYNIVGIRTDNMDQQITEMQEVHLPVLMFISAFYTLHANKYTDRQRYLYIYRQPPNYIIDDDTDHEEEKKSKEYQKKLSSQNIFDILLDQITRFATIDKSKKETLDKISKDIVKIQNNFRKIGYNFSEIQPNGQEVRFTENKEYTEDDFTYNGVYYLNKELVIDDAIKRVLGSIAGIVFHSVSTVVYYGLALSLGISIVTFLSVTTCFMAVVPLVEGCFNDPTVMLCGADCSATKETVETLFSREYKKVITKNKMATHATKDLMKTFLTDAIKGKDADPTKKEKKNVWRWGGKNKTMKRRMNNKKIPNKTKRNRKNKTHKKVVRKRRNKKVNKKNTKRK